MMKKKYVLYYLYYYCLYCCKVISPIINQHNEIHNYITISTLVMYLMWIKIEV